MTHICVIAGDTLDTRIITKDLQCVKIALTIVKRNANDTRQFKNETYMCQNTKYIRSDLIMSTASQIQDQENQDKKVTMELSMNEFKRLQRLLELDNTEEKEQKEREQQAKNHNFIQLYKDSMPELRWLSMNNPFAHGLLFFILEHMDNRNALACSYSVFEDYFDKSRSTIYRGIKALEENGFVDILKMGTSNVYIVNENIAWTDKNSNKKYAKYDGKILVSKKENKDYEFRNRFDKLKSLRDREELN